jgi:4-amino-4-deoxy-L-arabinose transferase-like glycosyltransferase
MTGERTLRAWRWAAAALLVALTAASCLLFQLRGRLPFTSDQGIVGLMALDILEKGMHPVFYYGSEYAGSLEPHYLALLFALFGPSLATSRAGMLLLVAATVLTVAGTARSAYGDRAGWFAGLYLALGPAYFLYKGLTSDGAYTSLLLLLAIGLALLLRIAERLTRGLNTRLDFGLLGLAFGLAWWVHSLAICLVPAALLSSFLGAPREWRRARAWLPLGAGFLAGSFPWWIKNLHSGWASLRASEMAPAAPGRLVQRIGELFWHGWTHILGGRLLWRRNAFTFPGAPFAALSVLALAVGFGIWTLRRSPSRPARHASALFLTLLVTLVVLSFALARTTFKEPRYLLPSYLAFAPLLGGLLAALWPRRALFAALALLLLALGLGSELRAPRFEGREMTFIVSDPKRVVAALEARGIRDLYASYWAAYRIVFLSRGRVTASPFGNATAGLVRVVSLRDRLERVADPAFLLCCEDLSRFRDWLSHGAVPHREEPLEGFTLVTGLPPTAVAELRRCSCIPEVPEKGAVTWLAVDGPHAMTAGEEARYRVSFYNHGRRPFSSNVYLSYHWLRPDGGVEQADGLRSRLPPLGDDWWRLPWRKVEADVEVKADVGPGDHVLVFDLVDENVSWFEGLGSPPAPYRVAVRAAPK